LNIEGLMNYWSAANNMGGGALWNKLPLGEDILTGSMMSI